MFHFKFIFYKCHYVGIVIKKKRNLLHFSFCCSTKHGGWQLHFSRDGEASKYKKTRKIGVRLKASSSCSWKWALRLFQGSDVLSYWFMRSNFGFVTKSNTIWKLLLIETAQEIHGYHPPSSLLRRQRCPRISGKVWLAGSSLEAVNLLPHQLQRQQPSRADFPPTPHQSPFPLRTYLFRSHKSCKLRKMAHRVKLWKKYETLWRSFWHPLCYKQGILLILRYILIRVKFKMHHLLCFIFQDPISLVTTTLETWLWLVLMQISFLRTFTYVYSNVVLCYHPLSQVISVTYRYLAGLHK